MEFDQRVFKEGRLRIAERIVDLSDKRLSTKVNTDHVTLKVGANVAVVVSSSNRVGFYIRSTDLLERAKAAGLNLQKAKVKYLKDEYKYHFPGLTIGALDKDEPLFRAIIQDSLDVVQSPRPKRR